ncbi:MAG: PAS domain S-box protein [Desulfobacterales bacterium]|jgi:PAS domain S-box-containing protein
MKKLDGKPEKSDAPPTIRSKNDRIYSGSDTAARGYAGKHSPPVAVSTVKAGSFEHKILTSSLNGIYIYDLEIGRNIFINPQYTRLTGYTLEDLQAFGETEFLALFHPQDQKRVAAHWEQIGRCADDETLEIEYRFKTADGRWIWCLSRDTVLERDGQGDARRVVGTFLDTTGHKATEKKLEHERELLQTIIDTVPVMITIYDPALKRFSFNQEFRRVLGWSDSDMTDGDPMKLFYPDPSERAAAQQFMESLEPGWQDFKVTAKDGDPVESQWANIRLSDDTQIGIGIDIRERKRAEAALKRARDNLNIEVQKRTAELEAAVTALKNEIMVRKDLTNQLHQWSRVFMDAADPIIIENLSGTIIDMNRAAEKEYRWRREELIGKSIRSLIPSARYRRAKRLRARCYRGEEVRNWEGMRRDQQGRIFSVLLTAFPLLDESGKITSLATIAKDITLRKQMESELEKTQQHLRELSRKSIEVLENDRRTIAKELHDGIGVSLAAIKFKLEGIAEEIAPKPQKAFASLNETISFLQAAITETKKISATLRPTILDDLGLLSTITWYTRQLSEQFGNIQLNRKIEVREEDIPETLKIVIYRVLQECLHNAVKHSEATEISISLKSDAHQIVLEIDDNGCGFDVQKILSGQDPLSGYGIASMIERAEIAGGSLMIDSSPEKGTCIRMILYSTL